MNQTMQEKSHWHCKKIEKQAKTFPKDSLEKQSYGKKKKGSRKRFIGAISQLLVLSERLEKALLVYSPFDRTSEPRAKQRETTETKFVLEPG